MRAHAGTNEAGEIERKYQRAFAVKNLWAKWQQLLFERAELLELKPERRARRAAEERDALRKTAEAFAELMEANPS